MEPLIVDVSLMLVVFGRSPRHCCETVHLFMSAPRVPEIQLANALSKNTNKGHILSQEGEPGRERSVCMCDCEVTFKLKCRQSLYTHPVEWSLVFFVCMCVCACVCCCCG